MKIENYLAVQWLGFCALTAEGWGSIPVRGTKIPQAMWHSQEKKRVKIERDSNLIYSGKKSKGEKYQVAGNPFLESLSTQVKLT